MKLTKNKLKEIVREVINEGLSKKEYQDLAKEFVGEYKNVILKRFKQDGYADIQLMVSDMSRSLLYDPKYKSIDADWLYDAVEKELKKQSWWKRLGARL